MGRPGSGSRKAPGLEKTLGKAGGQVPGRPRAWRKPLGRQRAERIRAGAGGSGSPDGWEAGGRGGSRCADRRGGPGGPGRRGGGRH
ncbi:unnamed protein product, partial [Rangifer tarandus platyrhynchus]